MAGSFYRAPAPGEPAFCKEGDRVSKGQTVCIIEAMKLMNEIEVCHFLMGLLRTRSSCVQCLQSLFKTESQHKQHNQGIMLSTNAVNVLVGCNRNECVSHNAGTKLMIHKG